MKHNAQFMPYALTPMPHKNLEEACRVIIRYFPEVPHGPVVAGRKGPTQPKGMPCLKIDSEKGVMYFELDGRENELAEFYDRYLAEDLDYFDMNPENYASLYKLDEMFREQPWPELKYIHLETIGPYTWGFGLKDENGVPAFFNDTLRDVIIKQLAMMMRCRQRKVKQLFPGVPILLNLAEPSLGIYNSAVGTGTWDVINEAINEVIAGVDGIAGIHCCDNFDWSLLMKTDIDLINFDAYHYGNTMSLYTDELKRFLERGGMIAWGIVPTTGTTTGLADIENENPDSLAEKLDRIMQSITDSGIDRQTLFESSWVTPTCSTQSMSTGLAERVFDYTTEVSRLMRGKYS